jgi:microcin C transport system substrate-binding protein
MRAIVLLLLIALAPLSALADDGPVTRSSAIAILGKPALPPDFPYFPYVNPNAPKGGDVTLSSVGTYDNFNPFILRGTRRAAWPAPGWSCPAARAPFPVGHLWESLLTSSADEISTGYGHRRDHRTARQQAVGGI